MFYIYWLVSLLLAISVGIIMAAHYELKCEQENSKEK